MPRADSTVDSLTEQIGTTEILGARWRGDSAGRCDGVDGASKGMAARRSHISVNCGDAFELSEWSKQVLGYDDLEGDPNEPGDEECMILDPTSDRRVLFIEVDQLQEQPGRIHLDLAPTDRRKPDGTGWVVLADPAGNHFCIVRSDEKRHER